MRSTSAREAMRKGCIGGCLYWNDPQPPQVNAMSALPRTGLSTSAAIAPVERRVDAIQAVLHERGMKPAEFIETARHLVEEQWVPANSAGLVAKACNDPEFRARLLADGKAAGERVRLRMPRHHRRLVVLENTRSVHNVICCTLCSCTAFAIIGLPPDWYKDLEYRARVVRESRTVLAEMGLVLPAEMEVRVWDTTADARYMVLPLQPGRHRGLVRGAAGRRS